VKKKLYGSLAELQSGLDLWLKHYNNKRTHQGKMCIDVHQYRRQRMANKSGRKSWWLEPELTVTRIKPKNLPDQG